MLRYPREVEEVLLRHPAVMQAAVIGALCLAHIAHFKRPKRYNFVDALPTSHYGKVPKNELRILLARLEAGRAAK